MPNLYNNYPYYPQPTTYPAQMNIAPVQPTQQTQPQIQNGGFIPVPNEEIVATYPVAPGNCITFKIEGKPIVLEKSMGFSNLEAPKIERYRLVKEDATETNENRANCGDTDSVEGITIKNLERKIGVLEDALDALEKKVDANLPHRSAQKPGQNYGEKKSNR